MKVLRLPQSNHTQTATDATLVDDDRRHFIVVPSATATINFFIVAEGGDRRDRRDRDAEWCTK